MNLEGVPAALKERLGLEATSGLLHLLDVSSREGKADVIAVCTERFERRLVEEMAGLRVQIAQTEASIRQDMAQMKADLRQEMAQVNADLRQEMAEMKAALRHEMAQMGADLRRETAEMGAGIRQEIATGRVEILKWCFLFWIGQVVTLSAILGVMLRLSR